MRRFITLGTIALIAAAMVTQWQRVRELGRQVLSRGREQISVSGEENKAIVRRFLEETMAEGNLEVIDELAAPDFVDHSLMPEQALGSGVPRGLPYHQLHHRGADRRG
jgi:hypothetical protein